MNDISGFIRPTLSVKKKGSGDTLKHSPYKKYSLQKILMNIIFNSFKHYRVPKESYKHCHSNIAN